MTRSAKPLHHTQLRMALLVLDEVMHILNDARQFEAQKLIDVAANLLVDADPTLLDARQIGLPADV